MKNRVVIITAILLLISISNYVITIEHGNVRAVEFLSILVIGVLTGVLLTQIIQIFKDKK
jgi:hypothetical protein